MPSDMSLSDKPISTPPKRPYATRSATKSENSTTNGREDHHSSSPSELNQISKHLKSQSRNLKSKNITTPTSSPCELSQASDWTSRNPTTKKSTVEASLSGSLGRVSKDQHNSQDAAPKKSVTPKKRIVSASSQKSSQLSMLLHSKKTKDLKAEDQPSTIPCSSSQEATQFLKDQHTTKDSKLGNKTESSSQEPSQPSKDRRPKKTENSKLKKSEILTPSSSKPSEDLHALGSKHSESKKIVINTGSLSKSMQPSKQQSAMRISKQSTPMNNENVVLSLRNSNLFSKSELAHQKGKAKLLEQPPKQSFKKSRVRYFITWDGFEEPETEPCGLNCYLCEEDLAYSLDEEENDKGLLPEVAVLDCGHAFHSICLSLHTSEKQYSREPKCLACLGFS